MKSRKGGLSILNYQFLICHFYHGKPDHLVAGLKAGLEDLNDGVLTGGLVLHVHHRVVEVGVKGLTQGWNLLQAQLR